MTDKNDEPSLREQIEFIWYCPHGSLLCDLCKKNISTIFNGIQADKETAVEEAEHRGQAVATETLQNFKSAARKAQGMLGGSPMIHADEIIRLANVGLRQLHPQAGGSEEK